MAKMSLGNTFEEKKATYEVLRKNQKKWGKVFAILGAIFGLFLSGIILSGSESIIGAFFIAIVLLVLAPICYYWYGQIVYYGYLAVRVFFQERNIGAGTIAGAVGTSVLVSYALGGKKAVKKVGVAWIIVLFKALSIGIFAGLYYYTKFQKEAKELGLISDINIKSQKI